MRSNICLCKRKKIEIANMLIFLEKQYIFYKSRKSFDLIICELMKSISANYLIERKSCVIKIRSYDLITTCRQKILKSHCKKHACLILFFHTLFLFHTLSSASNYVSLLYWNTHPRLYCRAFWVYLPLQINCALYILFYCLHLI